MPTTAARLLSLLSLLQSRRSWPGPQLAERLEVSQRTVRRDIDRLRELGYPIAALKGPEGGYRLQAGSELPPLLFDEDQAVAIAVALRQATTSGAGIGEAAIRALSTVRQVMPDRLRRRIDAVDFTAIESPTHLNDAEVKSEVLVAIGSAIHASQSLRFGYQSVTDEKVDEAVRRNVQPHHLFTIGERWYLLAWDVDRDDWRIFRVDRIALRDPTGVGFTPRDLPGGSLAAFVISRFRGSNDLSAQWPCSGEVILDRPATEVRSFVREGIVEELGPRRCRLVVGSWSWLGLASMLGQFDADIEVVGPAELVEAFDILARRYAHAVTR